MNINKIYDILDNVQDVLDSRKVLSEKDRALQKVKQQLSTLKRDIRVEYMLHEYLTRTGYVPVRCYLADNTEPDMERIHDDVPVFVQYVCIERATKPYYTHVYKKFLNPYYMHLVEILERDVKK